MNPRIQELAANAKESVPSNLLVDEWKEHYNHILAQSVIKEIEGYIVECEGDVDYVRFLIDTKLKGESVD